MQAYTADRHQQQRAIQGKCVHPTGTFLPFTTDEVEHSLPERFEQQVRRYPDRLAIKTLHSQLTYAALNHAANRVAHAILTQCGPGAAPIALLFAHDTPVIVAILGVLKAGKLYVPLDPSFPPARHTAILQDAQPELLLTNSQHLAAARTVTHTGCPVLNLDALDAPGATENPGLTLSLDTLADIVYTSGSTGRPKGVVQTHRYLLHKVMIYTNDIHLCADDHLSLLHSCSVGASERNLFGALLNGATVFPFEVRAHGPAMLASWLHAEAITVLHMIPTVFRQFIETLCGQEPFSALRLIQLGGAQVTRWDVEHYQRHFSSHCILLHNLSSTETGTMGRYFIDKATPLPGQMVPAGYPPAGTEVMLLDEAGQEVGVNGVGEIAVKSRYGGRDGHCPHGAHGEPAGGRGYRTVLISARRIVGRRGAAPPRITHCSPQALQRGCCMPL
jgi:non-ribosomal peptide synthetase component F